MSYGPDDSKMAAIDALLSQIVEDAASGRLCHGPKSVRELFKAVRGLHDFMTLVTPCSNEGAEEQELALGVISALWKVRRALSRLQLLCYEDTAAAVLSESVQRLQERSAELHEAVTKLRAFVAPA